jgi:cytochrome c oxidase cbb3-type subunit 3
MNAKNKNSGRKVLPLLILGLSPLFSVAAETKAPAAASYITNPLFNTLLFVIALLAIMIIVLSKALKNIISSDLFLEKIKKDKEASKPAKTVALLVTFSLLSFSAFAEGGPKTDVVSRIGGLDLFTFSLMAITIFVELLVLGILFNTFKNLLRSEKVKTTAAAQQTVKPKTKSIFDKLNDIVDIEEEESILLDHDYDGIKELDNNLPPWWKYGFYLTIIVAIFYMINYHITKTSPLQAEEYRLSVKKAEAEIAEFMKTSANNVDESTVKLLTAPADLAAGKDIFLSTCSACHGRGGEGTVGPNLTDDYWLHSGSVRDIFKTIKYGYPDKGMKSWKDDYSPMQIAQLASFIRSLRGTKPDKAKEKQGELFIETEIKSDSAAAKPDSLKVMAAQLGK